MATLTARLLPTLPFALLLLACGQAANDGPSVTGEPRGSDPDVAAPSPDSDGFVSTIGAGLDACTGTQNASAVSLTRQPEFLTAFRFVPESTCESLDRSGLLRNTGPAPLRITGIALDQPAFSMPSLALPTVLQPGDALAVPVRFRGDEILDTTMTIATDAGCSTFDVHGVTADEVLFELSAAALDFGHVPVGGVSEARRVTIQVQATQSGAVEPVFFGTYPEGTFELVSEAESPVNLASCERIELELRFRSPGVPGPVTGQLGYGIDAGYGYVDLYGSAVSE